MPSRHAARRGWMDAAALRAGLLLAVAVPALVTVGALPAKADEAYVCEGGRVVTVRMGELELLKRKDPCIAAYYGVKLGAEAAPAETALAAALESALEPPLPVRKPDAVAATTSSPADAIPVTPAIADAASLPRAAHAIAPEIVRSPRVEQVVFRHAVRAVAEPVAQTTAAAVDFRRVPIINAAPGAPSVFYHTR